MHNRVILTSGMLLVISVLFGCAGLQPVPYAARSGDTIVLAVGSPEDMTGANTTISFVSDAAPGNYLELTDDIVAIFNVSPDKLSRSAMDSDTRYIPEKSGHEPRQGIIAIDLPDLLPVGTGTLTVNTSAENPVGSSSIDGLAVALEILPGAGESNPLRFMHNTEIVGNITDLESIGHCELRPDYDPEAPGVWPLFGAVEIRVAIAVRDDMGNPVPDSAFAVVFQDMTGDSGSQMQVFWEKVGDAFTVRFVSPNGIKPYEPRFAVVPKPGAVVESVYYPETIYYDIEGQPVSGPSVTPYLNGEEAGAA